MLGFKTLNLGLAVLSTILFGMLLVNPGQILDGFAVDQTASAEFISRRAAMLFLGIAVLAYGTRNVVATDARRAISAGFGVTMGALAALGTVEFVRGVAGPGIWPAIATEFAFALSYALVACSEASPSDHSPPSV
ncbi:MAG: hypothetical protein AAGA48_40520 [Myxococcota bacterium]